MEKQWYETLFENYAQKYDEEIFTKGTIEEIDFIEKEIGFDKSLKILDVGCGTGRHAIELAKRGYNVVGVDLSEAQLKRAKEKAYEANVQVDFIHRDARKLPFNQAFDVVLMICEGGFSLMETDEMNYDILKGCGRALKKSGKFIFTTLNGLYPLYHSVKDFINSNQENRTNNHSFDLMTFRDKSEFTFSDDNGVEKTVCCNERYYVPSEIMWLLKSLMLKNIDILGCDIGKWSRKAKLSTEHYEMLVIAEK